MNPLVFGSSERALFGIYSTPHSQPGRNRGVIICNPFGDEAIKAHRALMQLANKLAAERFHVLRFDYFGTGDSAGEGSEATATQWIDDVRAAADELKDASGVAKVSFVGLRYGATLALQGANGRRDVDRVALWDPIVVGSDYARELKRVNEAYLKTEFLGRVRFERLHPATGQEVMGFPMPRALREEIVGVDLRKIALKRLRKVVLVASRRRPEYDQLCAHLAENKIKVNQQHIPVGINWNSDDAMDRSLVPTEAIQAIVGALS